MSRRNATTAATVLAVAFGSAAAVADQAAAVTVSNLTVRTNTPNGTLNLRSCGSTGCNVLRRVPHGTSLAVSAASGDWFRTNYSGATGWVHSRYTVLQGKAATTVRRGSTDRRMVAFTFDAGSDLGYTWKILDFLKAKNIPAGFGLTGTWAKDHPLSVKRIATEGHTMINHTWSHPSFTGYSTSTAALTPARRTEQLVRADDQLRSLAGRTSKPYFRPPYGDYDSSVLRDVGANGYTRNVMWSVDSLGWKGLTAAQICNRVVGAMDADSNKGNGYIVLFHVGSQSQDANALSCITTKLKERGFSFGGIAQVLSP
jgi:peptidoglycan/xylan/chitin deacetylase (PgdA/CDA1 family)